MSVAQIVLLAGLLAPDGAPDAERMLLGASPFFRHEGMERAQADQDWELLRRAAAKGPWDARRLAAIGLGPRTPHALLRDPVASVRLAAVEALDNGAPEFELRRLASDKDDAVRAAVAWALRTTRQRTGLRALSRDPSPAVRRAASAALGDFTRLRRDAQSEDPGVAVPALLWLGRAGGSTEAGLLIRRLRKVLRAKVRPRDIGKPTTVIPLARAVGHMARRGVNAAGRSVAGMLRKLAAEAPATLPAWLVLGEAVAAARDEQAARLALAGALQGRDQAVAADIVANAALAGLLFAMTRRPWPEIEDALKPYLTHKHPAVRAAGVRALSPAKAKAFLFDAHPFVRAVACRRCDDIAAVVKLTIVERDPNVLKAASALFARKADPACEAGLGRQLTDGDVSVRRAAVGALLRIPFKDRLERLTKVGLTDEAVSVRRAAAAALDFLDGDMVAFPAAIRALRAEEPAARTRAIGLLHLLSAARLGYDPEKPGTAEAWEQWWQKRSARKRPKDGFRYHVEDLRRRGIDLVLVLDATGSMEPILQGTKARLRAVVARLRRIVPNTRVRVVAYRDRRDHFVTLGSPLTHDPEVLEGFLSCIPAYGGGDREEAVLAGLRNAFVKTPWRDSSHRVVVLFGDAPPHASDEALLKAIVKEFSGQVSAVDVAGYARGGTQQALQKYKDIAKWGRGIAITLANEDDLLKKLLVLTLGPRFRTEVEALFGL